MKQCNIIKKPLLIGFPMVCILLMAIWGMGRTNQQAEDTGQLKISLDSGFYTEDQTITIDVPVGAVVYYTDDCREPDLNHSIEYSEPISLAVSEEEQVFVYRFKAYYEDGRESRVWNRTYFTGTNIDVRFQNNVLHVAGNPDDLFGYEDGIFVPGRDYDEYRKANPEVFNVNGVEGNFTRRGAEAEREVYIEYFTPEGKSMLSQECGVRIYGAMTRMKNQKSFRLYARKEYDEQNEFKYPVLTRMTSLADGTIAGEHKRLIVRNAGNDNGFGFIRSELAGRLAGEAGFPDVMQAEPVCVFINGNYYGIYWLENGFDAQYFVNRYGEYPGEFVVLEGGDGEMQSDEEPRIQSCVEAYNQFYTEFAALDLTEDENFEKLQEILDVENYLQYFAIENYLGNVDWPQNNVRVYRYVSPDGSYQEGTVFDGRYRHMLYDVDYAFGLMQYSGTIGTQPEDFTLWDLLYEDEAPLFAAIMAREDCQAYFTSYTLDLLNTVMSYRHVEKTLAEMHLSRYEELYHMLEETDLMEDSLWDWEDASIHYDNVEANCQSILEYAKLHPETAMTDMTLNLGYDFGTWYTLYVAKNAAMSDMRINTIFWEDETFQGVYFGEIPVELTPVMAKNEVFEHWLVNGEIREEEALVLTAEDIIEGSISVEMVVHAAEEPVLQLNQISAKGQNDYIELINLSDKAISTRGYYLSDSEDAYRYALPATTIEPGDTQRYYGKNNSDTEVLGRNGMNFSLKEGETVTLTLREDLLEAVRIPDLSTNGIYRRDGNTGRFIEILKEGD